MKSFLKKLLIFIAVGAATFGLINYCASSIDKNRKEKAEREQKLETGTCAFNTEDLDNLKIINNEARFTPVTDLSTLQMHYSEPLRKVNIEDSSDMVRTATIDNNDFKFYVKENMAFVTEIGLDLSSQFKFSLPGKKEFSCSYEIKDIEQEFPKSWECRESILKTNRTENIIVRIDNLDPDRQVKFILLYFNFTEQLYKIEIHYKYQDVLLR